jgi:hypothetical protein
MNQRKITIFAMISVLAISFGCDANRIDEYLPQPEAEEWPGKLRAGVALPQTLPDGTQVGFSVDYKFRSYTPDAQAQYVWEIRSVDGSIEQLAVQIAGKKGTLSQFLPVRPEMAPFTSRICVVEGQEGQLTPLTDWVSMQ